MINPSKKITTIDECIATYPEEVQEIMQKIRQLIQKTAPEATEAMSYGIPTFKLNGNLIHFSAYKKHIGLYPGSAAITAFAKDLTEYKTSKGTIQFPLDKPIPYDLIKKITEFKVKASLDK